MKRTCALMCAVLAALTQLGIQTGRAQTYTNLINPGCGLLSDLTPGTDGNLYGIGNSGGTPTGGAFYQFNPVSNSVTILHSFSGGTNGSTSISPEFGVVRIGTTYYGSTLLGGYGNNSCMYSINQDGTGFNLFYTFTNLSKHLIESTPVVIPNSGGNLAVIAGVSDPIDPVVDIINTNGTLVEEITMTNYIIGGPGGQYGTPQDLVYWNNTLYGVLQSLAYTNITVAMFRADLIGQTVTNVYRSTPTNGGGILEDIGVDSSGRLLAPEENAILAFSTNSDTTPVLTITNFSSGGGMNLPVLGPDSALYVTRPTGGSGYGSFHRIGPKGTNDLLYSSVSNGDGTSGPNVGPGKLVPGNDGCFYGTTKDPYNTSKPGIIFRYSNPMPTTVSSANFNTTNGTSAVSWYSVLGESYLLQANPVFAQTGWTNLTSSPITATGGITTLMFTNPNIGTENYFYMLKVTNVSSSYIGILINDSVPNYPPPQVTEETALGTNTYTGPNTNGIAPPPAP